jgi:hypothetical protein
VAENAKGGTGGGPTPFGLASPVPASACTTTGSVPSAYTQFNEASNQSLYQDLESLNGENCLAIGVLGLELAPEVNGTTAYQFVKINGADPYARVTSGSHVYATYANEISGSYDLFYTLSYNFRTGSINGGGYEGDGTYHSVFIDTLFNTFSNGLLPGGISGQFPLGVAGALLDPAVQGAAGQCVTIGTRSLNSQKPLEYQTYSVVSPTKFACNDQLDIN